MPDILNENGLQIKTLSELVSEKENALRKIFGEEILLTSNTPDGQLINIDAQAGIDLRERIVDVYNSFDPDRCIGRLQDSRYKINNIYRNGGTFTVQPIDIKISKTVSLEGLDGNYNDANATAYGVKDSAGNVWYLIDSVTITDTEGINRLPFRAKEVGVVEPIVGEITEQIKPMNGVISVINSVAPTSIGIEEETDVSFQIRRNQSVAIRGQGNTDTILGQIRQLDGVSDARVYSYNWESYPNVDENGLNPHFIWAIVEGGANEDIGEVLYTHSGGSGMRGEVSVDIFTQNQNYYKAKFDRPTAVPLHIKFSIQETESNTIFDYDGIKEYIKQNLSYSIGDFAETSKPTLVAREALNQYSTSGAVVNLQISNNGTNWVSYIPCPTVQSQFVIDSTRIIIEEINL